MSEKNELLEVVQTALGTLECRQSFSPGMFEPLAPLFKKLGYESVAVYIADDYPDRMHLISGYGGGAWFPPYVALNGKGSLFDQLMVHLKHVPGVLAAKLFSHGRELGALAVTVADNGEARVRDAFQALVQSLSVMAYVERIRTNDHRERHERELFFAQSLTNRLLIRQAPTVKGLRLGFEFNRSLEAGGDFFDLMPVGRDGLLGFIGCCNGSGLRTVLEVASIMREVHRACQGTDNLSEVLFQVNDLLVKETHRAHQASLCVFRVDTGDRTVRLAKAGRLGLLLCGPGGTINNISAPGGLFLGMAPKPKFREERFDFAPGQALFCVTEGLYSSLNVMNVKPQLHWFLSALETVLESRPKIPLVNAVFANLDSATDFATRPREPMLALSVEFRGK